MKNLVIASVPDGVNGEWFTPMSNLLSGVPWFIVGCCGASEHSTRCLIESQEKPFFVIDIQPGINAFAGVEKYITRFAEGSGLLVVTQQIGRDIISRVLEADLRPLVVGYLSVDAGCFHSIWTELGHLQSVEATASRKLLDAAMAQVVPPPPPELGFVKQCREFQFARQIDDALIDEKRPQTVATGKT